MNNVSVTWIQMQWLIEHPDYISNRIYIAADSYSGLLVPIISQHILDGKFEWSSSS